MRLLLAGLLLFTTSFHPVFASKRSVGEVSFTISCDRISQDEFNEALALSHHMMYVQAETLFQTIVRRSPNCAMAYWGIAFTQIHPLWPGTPSAKVLEKGSQALAKAIATQDVSEKEKAFITALKPLYHDWQSRSRQARLSAWEAAQKTLYQRYPEDPEAIALYALSHLATAPKGDKSFQHQKDAGKLLEELHAKFPLHPAGFHYTIHAYDNPALASKAEQIARGYDKVAPDVPHALHMPSHIFVRLGYWPETIKWNLRSEKAAENQPLPGGVVSMHYAHAIDYLMYAYLQEAQDDKAKQVLTRVDPKKQYQDSFATAYGLLAARARYYLERKDWRDAVNQPLTVPSNFPWRQYPAVMSMAYFAKGFAAIQLGQLNVAKKMIHNLSAIETALSQKKQTYWSVLVNAKIHTLVAWINFKTGRVKPALKFMRFAAKLEDSVDKHPVTPGEILPARELLGQMLLQDKQYEAAEQAFKASLALSPNRYYSVYGLALSADKAGDKKTAREYYQKFLKLTMHGDQQRAEIKAAKAALAN